MNPTNDTATKTHLTRLNVKLILTVLGLIFVLAIGVHFLHGLQVKRNAQSILDLAEKSQQAGELGRAIEHYRRYLALRPNDIDGLAKLALLLDETSVTFQDRLQAFLAFEEVLRRDPQRHELRRKSIDTSVEMGRFKHALREIDLLPETYSGDSQLTLLSGRCHEGMGEFSQAAQSYANVISQEAGNIDGYVRLVKLIQRHAKDVPLQEIDPQERDDATLEQISQALMAAVVERGEPKFRAFLARADYFKQRGDLQNASRDVEAALELVKNDPDVLLNAVDLAVLKSAERRHQGKADEANKLLITALDYIARGLQSDSPDPRFYLAKSRVAMAQGNTSEAVASLQAGLAAIKNLHETATHQETMALLIQEQHLTFSLADILITIARSPESTDVESELKAAEELVLSLRRIHTVPRLIDFLDARIQATRNKWQMASLKLEEIRPQFSGHRDLIKRIDLELSRCYDQLGNPDAQLAVWRRTIAESTLWDEARWNLASALTRTGRLDEAIQEYRPILNRQGVAIRMAQLMVLQQLKLPAEGRRWDELLSILDIAAQTSPDTAEVPILRAELAALQGQFERADEILQAALLAFPQAPGVRTSLANLALQRDESELSLRIAQAEQILDQAEEQLGDLIDLRIGRVDLAEQLTAEPAQAVLDKATVNLAALDSGEQYRLLIRLARAYNRIGNKEESAHYWRLLARQYPRDVTAQWLLAELALQEGDRPTLESAIASIRAVEGAGGPIGNYLKAAGLLKQSETSQHDSQTQAEARKLLQAVVRERPSWVVGWRALGMLEDLAGNGSEAIEHFRKAMALGDRSRDVVSRVVQSLFEQQRFDEADEEIQQIGNNSPQFLTGDLARLAWKVAWQRQQFDRALGLADEIATEAPNYRDLIWLGQLRFARGKRGGDVEKPLRDAIQLSPDSTEAWFALVAFLARVGRVDDARTVIDEASGQIAESSVPLFQAHCYELLQMPEQAEKSYLAAIRVNSRDPENIRSIADFYSRSGNTEQAEDFVDQLLAPDSGAPKASVDWARRRKALLLASQGSYQSSHRALELLEQNTPQGDRPAVGDLQVKAAILAGRNTRRGRLEAIRVFDEIQQGSPLSLREQFELARLHEETGDWPTARELLMKILAGGPDNPEYISYHVEALARHGELEDAELWFSQLEKLEPVSLRTTTAAAELLGARGKSDLAVGRFVRYFKRKQKWPRIHQAIRADKLNEAVELLAALTEEDPLSADKTALAETRQFIAAGRTDEAEKRLLYHLREQIGGNPQSPARELLQAARICERLEQFDAAKQFFEFYAKQSNRAGSILVLAQFLARRGDVPAALDLCEKSPLVSSPELLAQAGVGIISEAAAEEEQIARVEKWVQGAVQSSNGSLRSLLAQGNYYMVRKRLSDAEAIYRLILESDEKNVVSLNNLAWLLAFENRNTEEALRFIERAIATAGHRAELIDTRGNIYLSQNQPEKAITDLREAVADSTTAVMPLHLANAYLQTGESESAFASWSEAERRGLDPNHLHPLDREIYVKLKPQFDKPAG